MGILINLLISALAVFITAYLLPGVKLDSFLTAVIVSVVLGIANSILKPILVFFTLPITILTLGLFTFVISALMVLLVDYFVPGFEVDSFLWALAFSFVLSLVNMFLKGLKS